jgi:hypothetical protein
VKLYMAVQYDEYDLYLHTRDVVFFVSYGVAWGLVAIAAYAVFLVVAHSRRVSAVRRTSPHACAVAHSLTSTQWAQGDRHGHGQVGVWSRAEVKAIVMRDWNTLVCAFIVANVVAAALVAPICISKQSFSLTRCVRVRRVRACVRACVFDDLSFSSLAHARPSLFLRTCLAPGNLRGYGPPSPGLARRHSCSRPARCSIAPLSA